MSELEPTRLLAFARDLQGAETFGELLAITRAELVAHVGYRHVWMFVADRDDPDLWRLLSFAGDESVAVWEHAPVLRVAGDAMLEEIVRSTAPVVVEDARIDPRTNKQIVEQLGNRTIISLALRLVEQPIGALGMGTFADEGPCPPTPAQLAHIIGMASQLVVAAGRIRFVEERRRADEELRKSEEDLRITLASIGDAVIATDGRGRIVRMNPVAERLTGWPAAEALGRDLDEVFHVIDEATRETAESPVDAVLREGTVVGLASGTSLIERSGHERAIADSAAPIRNPDGSLRGVVLVFRDQAEARLAQEAEALRRARDIAEQARRELETFAYSVVHDLRAPLRVIRGFNAALLDAPAEGDARAHLARIAAACDRMDEIVEGLLELAALSRVELRREPVELSPLARAVFEELRAAEPDPARRIELVVADGLVARADPRLARTVLENLLGNAIKFTRGRAVAHIEVGLGAPSEPGEAPHFFVRDDGAGFDMEFAEHLFTPFRRLHHQRDFEGTGIGLATVERIVRRHGGWIRGTGAVNAGATFAFTFSP